MITKTHSGKTRDTPKPWKILFMKPAILRFENKNKDNHDQEAKDNCKGNSEELGEKI